MKKLVGKYKNLKRSAKRVFTGLLVLSLICAVTGIGSIFAYADGNDAPVITEPYDPEPENTDNGNPDEGDPGDGNPDDGDPESGEPGGGNPEDEEPEGGEPGDGEPGGGNPEDGNPDEGNPDNGEPDDGDPAGDEPGSGDDGEGREESEEDAENEEDASEGDEETEEESEEAEDDSDDEKKSDILLTTAQFMDDTDSIKYNGGAKVSWYRDDVVITCDGQVISDVQSNDFSDFAPSYTLSKTEAGETGTVSKTLHFTEADPDANPRNFFVADVSVDIDTAAPVITEISTSKETSGTNITIRGTDSLSGISDFYVVARVMDGTETEPSVSELTASGYVTAAQAEGSGVYKGSLVITGLDSSKSYIFYCIAADSAGNYSEVMSKEGYSQEISLDIRYNGEELKNWYNTDVDVTVDGYMISLNGENKYHSKYTMTGSKTVTKKLDFRNNESGAVKTYDISVKIDKTAPTASFTLEDFTSKSFVTDDEVSCYCGKNSKPSISASDSISGVALTEYFVSDEFFPNTATLKSAMSADNKSFRRYAKGVKIALSANKENYVYVRVTDKAGNVTYISSGTIISDTTAPVLKSINVGKPEAGSDTLVAVTGTDALSGINRFKLMYQEKTSDKVTTPSKDDIFNNGIYLATSISEEESYGAIYYATDLDETKTYIFFAAAVDRAGNISNVSSYTTTVDDLLKELPAAPSSGAAAGGGSAAGSGSEGLAPAPSGIAGGSPSAAGQAAQQGQAGGTATGSGSESADSSGNKENEITNPLDQEIVRLPYIADATGSTKIGLAATGGWDIIISELKKADYGATIDVEMSGLGVIPAEAFNAIAGREITVKFLMPQGVVWVVTGENIRGEIYDDRNMAVKAGSKNIPKNLLEDITGTNPHFEFDIAYEGDFGFTATLSFPVGETNSGLYANLYHYKDVEKDFHLEESSVVTPDGYAEFEITHASSFSIVITAAPLLTDKKEIKITKEQTLSDSESLVSEDATLRIPDLFGLRGKVRMYLLLIAIISAALCVMILFMPALQLPKKVGNSR